MIDFGCLNQKIFIDIMMSFGSFVVGYALVDTVGTITCIGFFGCCLM